MKIIKLTNGGECQVDDADYAELSRHKWRRNDSGYAVRDIDGMPRRMHRILVDAPDHLDVDHKDNNRLNNQRGNLRIATRNMNNGNRVVRKDSKSGYKGVRAKGALWQARIVRQYKEIHLGYFQTAEDAARAYNSAALSYFGEFARLNPV